MFSNVAAIHLEVYAVRRRMAEERERNTLSIRSSILLVGNKTNLTSGAADAPIRTVLYPLGS